MLKRAITDPSQPQIATSSSENQPQVAPQVDKVLDEKPKSNKSDKKVSFSSSEFLNYFENSFFLTIS